MLFPPNIIHTIQECAHWADRLIRAELICGEISSENDYTSNFTGALRREINGRSVPGLKALVKVLNPSAERKLGADECIILEGKSGHKVGIFEAKWPRLSFSVDSWDSVQKSNGRSHFHSQLARQAAQKHRLAIWEMFYCEFEFERQPKYMPDHGSACIWHDSAYKASAARANTALPWVDAELIPVLKDHTITIADIMREICECRQGQLLSNTDYLQAFGDFGAPREALIISYRPPLRQEA